MPPSVLVVYASRYGSTKETAEAVAAGLREVGAEIDLRQFKETKSLEGYQAVVLGAPLQMNHWHKEAHRFLERHRQALSDVPAAAFAVGPVTQTEADWQQAALQLETELGKVPWFRPVETRIFGGRLDPDRLTGWMKLLPARSKLPRGDVVDLEAASAWGRRLAPKLAGREKHEETAPSSHPEA